MTHEVRNRPPPLTGHDVAADDALLAAVAREGAGWFCDDLRIVERMALVLQGSLLVRYAPHAAADAFCASRLAGDHGYAFGTLPAGTGTAAPVERAVPR